MVAQTEHDSFTKVAPCTKSACRQGVVAHRHPGRVERAVYTLAQKDQHVLANLVRRHAEDDLFLCDGPSPAFFQDQGIGQAVAFDGSDVREFDPRVHPTPVSLVFSRDGFHCARDDGH